MLNFKQYTFKELYDFFHNGKTIRLMTPDGPKNVIGAYKKHGKGVKIQFNDDSEVVGALEHLVLSGGTFVTLDSLDIGANVSGKIVTAKLDTNETTWYDFSLDYEHECYIQNGIIHHNSGKSAIIYSIIRYHLQYNRKIVIIVPSTSLVEQLYSDFEDYSSANGWNVAENCQKLYSGFSKIFTSKIMITTWQSIVKLESAWFNQFDVVMGDEAHRFRAASLVSILEKMTKVPYRIGTSGTLDDKLVHSLVLTGLFGPIHSVTTSKQLMNDKHIANLKIKCIVLKYDDSVCHSMRAIPYKNEVDFVVGSVRRNTFIANLAVSCKGNTLVLFNLIEKQGKPLHQLILKKADNRKVFFIYGQTPVELREAARELTASESDAIIVASLGVFSTGVNIPSIANIIFASPTKSKIRNLQSIGRGLRLDANKEFCTLFDISDNLTYKKHVNFGMKHLEERCQTYAKEHFDFKILEVPI